MKPKIFISYRRDTGSFMAKMIADRLIQKKYKCFLDVESLKSGDFHQKILSEMDSSDIFLLLLTSDALDRCSDPADFVRMEIEAALERNLTIIPLMAEDFEFPDVLPQSIDKIRRLQGIRYRHDYSEEFFQKLFMNIEEQCGKKSIPVIPVVIGLAVVILAAVLLLTKPLIPGKKQAVEPPVSTAAETEEVQESGMAATEEAQNAMTETSAPDDAGEGAVPQNGQILPDDFLLHMEELAQERLRTLADDNENLSLKTAHGEFDIPSSYITISNEKLSKKAIFYETGGVTGFFLCYEGDVQIADSWSGFLGPTPPESEYQDAAIVFTLDTFPAKFLDENGNLKYSDENFKFYKIYTSREPFEAALQEDLQYVDHWYYEIILP